MAYNLGSPTGLNEPCNLHDLSHWFSRELGLLDDVSVRDVVRRVARDLDSFVRWPKKAALLWKGCDRNRPDGAKQKYHSYPMTIRQLAKRSGIVLDTRPNGPAIASYQFAGGLRPKRLGSKNAWSIHHPYSGKFPYVERKETTHAAKEGNHFTQSAGLVAVHPVADALCDEFPPFAWLLRAYAFKKFGYDPDGVFSVRQNSLGFVRGRTCSITYKGS